MSNFDYYYLKLFVTFGLQKKIWDMSFVDELTWFSNWIWRAFEVFSIQCSEVTIINYNAIWEIRDLNWVGQLLSTDYSFIIFQRRRLGFWMNTKLTLLWRERNSNACIRQATFRVCVFYLHFIDWFENYFMTSSEKVHLKMIIKLI